VSGFPLLVEGAALPVLVVGGGPVAVRKANALAASGAKVRVVARAATP
jgi:siroheme synthase (precorrin-2 oxidase/ferrochelatase)